MATKVPIPKLGQSEETVTIEKWRVKEGDVVKKGDVLFDVETDKAVLEVESQFEGTLLKIVVPAGKEVPVMSVACFLGEPGEAIPAIEPPAAPAPKPVASAGPAKSAAAPSPPPSPSPAVSESTPAKSAPPSWRPKPSPRARRFAADYLINIDKVPGSGGENGRVTEADIRNYLETSGYNARKTTPAAYNLAKIEGLELLDIRGTGDGGRINLADVRAAAAEKPQKFNAMRKVIAERLAMSKRTIPHFYVTTAVDMSELLKKRLMMKDDGINLSVNVFVVKAVALALKEFPALNASVEGDTYRYRSSVNIGIAVSVDNGLVVPVVRDAERKPLDEIQAETAEFAAKARDGKLKPEDMRGGTFTISNMGMLDVENFAAIINPGESAILAVSSSVPSAVVRDGALAIRDIMKITVSADHRVVDGAAAAKFVNAVKSRLENSDIWEAMV